MLRNRNCEVLIAVLLVALLTGAASAMAGQDTPEIPDAIMKVFRAEYPDATILEKEKESHRGTTYFEIEFKLEETTRTIVYTAAGLVYEIEESVSPESLPSAVREVLTTSYAGFSIEEVTRIDRQGTILWEVELESGENSIEVLFDTNGKVLPAETDEDSDHGQSDDDDD